MLGAAHAPDLDDLLTVPDLLPDAATTNVDAARTRIATGRTEMRTPDLARAAALLGRAVVAADGTRLLVTGHDPAGLNAVLVGAGPASSTSPRSGTNSRTSAWQPPGRPASAPVPVIAVELSTLHRRPRTWLSLALLVALSATVASSHATTDVAPRPSTGPAFLSAVLSNSALFPAAAQRGVLPAGTGI